MQIFHKLEAGDKIFIITDQYKIKEIKLNCDQLRKDRKDRPTVDRPYQLESDLVFNGRVKLIKVTHHEEMVWDGMHVLKRWFTYEDTGKYAYLSCEAAEAALESQISEEERFKVLLDSVKKDLDKHVKEVQSILSKYLEDLEDSDLDDVAEKSDDHQKLLQIFEAIGL